MSTIEAQAILADAPRIVAMAIERGYAQRRMAIDIGIRKRTTKGIRTFTLKHRAKLRAARLRFCKKSKQLS